MVDIKSERKRAGKRSGANVSSNMSGGSGNLPPTPPTGSSTSSAGSKSKQGAKGKTKAKPAGNVKTFGKALPEFRDICDWASARKCVVSKADSKACDYMISLGWPVEPSSSRMSSLHPISHTAREIVVLKVLMTEGKNEKVLTVLDWYGSNRNQKLTPQHPPNGLVQVGTGSRPRWLRSSEALCVRFVNAPDTPVQGDRGRSFGNKRVALHADDVFDYAMVQDVYFDSVDQDMALSTKTIRHLATMTRTGHVYLCVRLFAGEAGSDAYGPDLEEGVWFRQQDGDILFSPDRATQPYPAHGDLHWLQYRHYKGIDVTMLDKIGPYWLLRCTVGYDGGLELRNQVPLTPLITKEVINSHGPWVQFLLKTPVLRHLGMMSGYIRGDEKTVEVYVCHAVAGALNVIFSNRVPSGPMMDSVVHKTSSMLMARTDMQEIASRFPEVYREILYGTVFYAMYANRVKIADMMASLRSGFAEKEVKLIQSRATANVWSTMNNLAGVRRRQFLVAASAASVFTVGFLWYKGYTPKNLWNSIEWNVTRPLAQIVRVFFQASKRYMFSACDFLSTMTRLRTVNDHVHKDNIGVRFLRHPWGETYKKIENYIYEGIHDMSYQVASENYKANPSAYTQVSLIPGQIDPNVEPHYGNYVHTMFLAPVYEELCRWFVPVIGEFIMGSEMAIHGIGGNYVGAVGAFAFHTTMGSLHKRYSWKGLFAAMGLHIVWNTLVCIQHTNVIMMNQIIAFENLQAASLWDTFLSCRKLNLSYEGAMGIATLPVGSTIPPYTSLASSGPEDFRGKIKIQVDNIDVTVETALDLLSVNPREDNVIYPVLVTNGLLWEPANNEKNLLVAILWRTHQDPFVECDDSEKRWTRWHSLSKDFSRCGIFDRLVGNLPTLAECAKLMGKRGERILRADEMDQQGINTRLWKTISLKWNETLNIDKTLSEVVTMKPRAIVNLDPIIHSRMSSYARACATILHERMNGQVHMWYGIPVRVFFAAGYTQKQLSSIVDVMGGTEVVLAVSGDDSVVCWGSQAGILGLEMYGECDQSQFDHTQDEGPQVIATDVWMSLMGLPRDFIDLCQYCCKAPYTARVGRLRVKGEAGVQMPTGITMTTVLNSLSTVFMYMWILKRQTSDIASAARELGFKTKYFGTEDVGQITFLRGWWRLSESGQRRVWMPLPSACLKLGKVLRDPIEICKYKDPATRQTVWKTGPEAVRVVAFALASSYSTVPKNYPILGCFLHTLRRCGDKITHADLHQLDESWRPKLDDENVDAEETMQAIAQRYDLTDNDIQRVSTLLDSVVELPALIVDPVFDVLKARDY